MGNNTKRTLWEIRIKWAKQIKSHLSRNALLKWNVGVMFCFMLALKQIAYVRHPNLFITDAIVKVQNRSVGLEGKYWAG
jgi:hypothetical protein